MNAEQRHRQQAGVRAKAEASRRLWDSRQHDIRLMYEDAGFSQQDIANHYHVSQTIIGKVMRQFGIASKGRGREGTANGRYKDGSHARGYRKVVVKDRCNRCSATQNLCIHHRDNDHFNNNPSNLEVLCKSCHLSHHKTEYWKARRENRKPPKSTGRVGWIRS